MYWYEKHNEWYEYQKECISRSKCYLESNQRTDFTLLSQGNIKLNLNGTSILFPILIYFPSVAPYVPPKIFILNELFPKDEFDALSAENIKDELNKRKKLYYFRHQMPDGSLCFIESERLYKESVDVYSIDEVLSRVRLWLKGTVTGIFPSDGNEVELFAHFPHRDEVTKILATEVCFNGNYSSGIVFITPVVNLTKEQYGIESVIYTSIALWGDFDSKILTCIYDKTLNISYLKDKFDMTAGFISSDKTYHQIESNELVLAFIWDISEEPYVFKSPKELIKLIGNGDEIYGLARVIEITEHYLKKDNLYFGLRFPNRRKEKEIQFFKLKRKEGVPVLFGKCSDEELLNWFEQHELIAIYTKEFTPRKYHLRNKGLANRDILSEKVVTILGVGALGSEVSDILGKAGVGNLNLIDKEILDIENPVRHLSGISCVGLPKSLAVNFDIRNHNSFIKIESFPYDITQRKRFLDNKDFGVGVSLIADDQVEGYVNEIAIKEGKIIFYARALRGGKTARLFRVIPGVDACKACLSIYHKEEHPSFINIPEDKTLPTLLNECNNPIRPASAAEIKLISGFVGRVIIDYLQSDSFQFNHWVLSTASFDGFELPKDTPLSSKAKFLPPHPKCKICQGYTINKVVISKKKFEQMKQFIKKVGKVETGGIIVGKYAQDGIISIEAVSNAGPNAVQTASKFEKDIKYCQSFLDEYQKDNISEYLGEWHSHVFSGNQPSRQDIQSITDIALQSNYSTNIPIMIIFSKDLEPSCTIHYTDGTYRRLELEVSD